MADMNPDDVELSPALAAQEEAEKAAPKKGKAKAETPAEAPPSEEVTEEVAEQPEAAAETPEATDEAAPEASDEDEPEKAEKERSKPPSKRIAELTKLRREAERRAETAEAELARLKAAQTPANDTGDLKKPDPNDAKYEFGEADPEYIADLVEWKAEAKFAERAKKDREEAEKAAREAEDARRQAVAQQSDAEWAEKAEKAVEKYPDFKETVVESAKSGKWDLLPLSAAAVQGSDVGDDIAYHLATHPDDAKRLADAERGFHATREAAMKAGMPPEVANMMAAPHLMRGQELFESIERQFKDKPVARAKVATDAPEPPKHTARGAGGKFTEDFSSDNCNLANLNKAIRG